MIRRRLGPVLLGLLTACGGPGPTAFVGGTLIDGTDAPPLSESVILVSDGRIECVGLADACPVPDGYDRIDLSGHWVIPGLIDTHIHPRFGRLEARTVRDQRLRFLLGITLTRDASTADNLLPNAAAGRASADPRRPEPRLIVAGRITGRDLADLDAAVARVAEAGAMAVKVHEVFSPEDLSAIGRASAAHGLPVYGHAWADDPVRSLVTESVEAGFAGLAHLLGISPLIVDQTVLASPPDSIGADAWRVWRRSLWVEADSATMDGVAGWLADRDVWVEPLLSSESLWSSPYRVPDALEGIAGLPFVRDDMERGPGISFTPEDRLRLQRSRDRIAAFVRMFVEKGGVVVTGSDESIAPGLAIHEEMRLLTVAGLTPEEALAAATSDAARVLGVADSLGTLEQGKLADFVVLREDPLADIEHTTGISWIVKAGVSHTPDDLLARLERR